MISHWLSWLNCTLIGLALLLGLAGGLFWFKRPAAITCTHPPSKECGLPKGAFELAEQAYHQVGVTLFALQEAPPTMQLPDLRQQLIYYGKNGRPDAQSTHTLLHFSLNGNKTVVSTPPGEKLYLVYDRKSTPGRYGFSPQNEKTSLWIEGDPVDNEVQIQVTLENDKNEKIIEPEAFARFRLPEKEFIRYAGTNWEIGTFRVDGTLLARQRARWFGVDRFLKDHGGDDHNLNMNKQRVDFGEKDDLYSVFVNSGDCLIWDQNHWKAVTPGEESLESPLLTVKKIDERLMTFELWDVEGKGKILLNLLKSAEPWGVQNAQSLQNMFKFVGAHTRTQCIFEINHERVILRPSDWLLLTPKGWKKLSTEEEIDDYVKRKLSGTLFVFDGISRKDERQIMTGTLYSPARNDCQSIELALQARGPKPSHSKESKQTTEAKEEEEDDDDDDDEEIKAPPITRNETMRQPMIPSKHPTSSTK